MTALDERIEHLRHCKPSDDNFNTYGHSTRVHRQDWPDGTQLNFKYQLVGACIYNTATPTQRYTDATCPTEDTAATAAAGWRFVGGRVASTSVSDAVGVLYRGNVLNPSQ